jgi:hypothetical protein
MSVPVDGRRPLLTFNLIFVTEDGVADREPSEALASLEESNQDGAHLAVRKVMRGMSTDVAETFCATAWGGGALTDL